MARSITSFTIHICNPETRPEDMEKYLTTTFGDWRVAEWYMGRNYSRPYDESILEIKFIGPPNKYHTKMMFDHPYTFITEKVSGFDTTFDKFFTIA